MRHIKRFYLICLKGGLDTAKMGSFNSSELKKFQEKMNKLQEQDIDLFIESCAQELAVRLLRKASKRTPVQKGVLRRGWVIGEIRKNGDSYQIEVKNPIEYASYVEYGHRTANHQGWVPGQFMMTISEQEIQQSAPGILENKIKKFLGGVFR